MQIKVLKRKASNRDIEEALLNLPAGLEETYNRALINWNADSSEWERTIRALNWLAFSVKPLTLGELAEAVIIELKDETPFDKERRFHRPKDLLHHLSGLVTVDGDGKDGEHDEGKTRDSTNSIRPASALSVLNEDTAVLDEDYQDEDGNFVEPRDKSAADIIPTQDRRIVRFAHFSVKEYLVSDRIEVSLSAYLRTLVANRMNNGHSSDFTPVEYSAIASYFPLKEPKAHVLIAESCLIYHLYVSKGATGRNENLYFPLQNYAANHGLEHAEVVLEELPQPSLRDLIFRTLTPQSNSFLFLRQGSGDYFGLYGSPLYFTAGNGWPRLSSFVLDNRLSTINEIGGPLRTALNVAARCVHESIVRLLLDAGPNPYLGSADYPCALKAAMAGTSGQCVRILSELPNAVVQCGKLGFCPLIAATNNVTWSVSDFVRHFLQLGCEVNARNRDGMMALAGAAYNQSIEVMELLLENGAEISARAEPYGNALQAAAAGSGTLRGCGKALKLLLLNGAKTDPPGPGWTDLPEVKYQSLSMVRLRALHNVCGETSRRSQRMTPFQVDKLVKRFRDAVQYEEHGWLFTDDDDDDDDDDSVSID